MCENRCLVGGPDAERGCRPRGRGRGGAGATRGAMTGGAMTGGTTTGGVTTDGVTTDGATTLGTTAWGGPCGGVVGCSQSSHTATPPHNSNTVPAATSARRTRRWRGAAPSWTVGAARCTTTVASSSSIAGRDARARCHSGAEVDDVHPAVLLIGRVGWCGHQQSLLAHADGPQPARVDREFIFEISRHSVGTLL